MNNACKMPYVDIPQYLRQMFKMEASINTGRKDNGGHERIIFLKQNDFMNPKVALAIP